jgi:hypothetical protein
MAGSWRSANNIGRNEKGGHAEPPFPICIMPDPKPGQNWTRTPIVQRLPDFSYMVGKEGSMV